MAGGAEKPRKTRYSSDPEEYRAPLSEHLEELRTRVIRCVLILTVAMVIGWYLQPPIYDHLANLVRVLVPKSVDYKETFHNVTEPFMLKLKVAFYIALILGFPFLVLQLWGFVAPGLKVEERKPMQALAPLSLVLFLLGAALCYMILPSAFAWFISYIDEFPNTSIYQEPGTMIFFILKMMLAFGIGFQLPIVVYFLNRVGLLGAETLKQHWRQVTVLVFFASAILTPSNDMFSMLMMAIPMTLLFFLSLGAIRIANRRRPSIDDEYAEVEEETSDEDRGPVPRTG